ncbi:MAG: ATP-binding protein [Candidatus Acidiferrales bacterium]
MNALTKFEFSRRGTECPPAVTHEYPGVSIIRKCGKASDFGAALVRATKENVIEMGFPLGNATSQGRISTGGRTRWQHSEWSQWPADVFVFSPMGGQNFPTVGSLTAPNEPYYPSLEQVLSEFFRIRNQGWLNYFQGQSVVVLSDYRARVSRLMIGLSHLSIELDSGTLIPPELLVKIYAEKRNTCLIQDSICPSSQIVQVDLADKPSFVGVAVLCKETGEMLHEKTFREGIPFHEPGIELEAVIPDVEQLLLTGESETIELKEMLNTKNWEKLAKTAVAFANTKGGTIIFGVNNDHRVVGCETKGMADWITDILRGRCDPQPHVAMRIVQYEGKSLFLVEVEESSSTVHTVKDLGPYIRANGSNRTPTSHELTQLCQRRLGVGLESAGFSFSHGLR